MDSTPNPNSQLEDPPGLPLAPASDESPSDESPSTASDPSGPSSGMEDQSTPSKPEKCDAEVTDAVRGEDDGSALMARGFESLEKCINSGNRLQVNSMRDVPDAEDWRNRVAICRSAKKAIESILDGTADKAKSSCTDEACQGKTKGLELAMRVFTTLAGQGFQQAYDAEEYENDVNVTDKSDETGSEAGRVEDMNMELIQKTARQNVVISDLEYEIKELKNKLQRECSARRGNENSSTNHDQDKEEAYSSSRWGPASRVTSVEMEKREESQQPGPMTEQRPVAGQCLEPDMAEASSGSQSPEDSTDSDDGQDVLSESQASQLKSVAAEAPNWEQIARDQEEEIQSMRTRLEEIETELRDKQDMVNTLQQDREDIQCHQERRPCSSLMLAYQPNNLAHEFGNLAASPDQVPCSPVSGISGFYGRRIETGGGQGCVLLREQCLAWRDVAFFLAFIIVEITWTGPRRILYSIRGSLQRLPLLKRVDWEKFRPAARQGSAFSTRGLLRAMRHVLLVLTVHALLSCWWERDMWNEANGLQRRLLVRQLHRQGPWWPVPGVDPVVAWDKGRELWGFVLVLTMDIWASWAFGAVD